MKVTLLILLLNLPVLSQDKYEGTFELSDHFELKWWEYDTFSFHNDSLFKFYRWTDYGALYGEGIYKIYKKKLTLYFRNIPKDSSGTNYVTISKEITTEDYVDYIFKIMDKEKKPLTWAMARTTIPVSNSDSLVYFYYQSNEEGIININIPKSILPTIIEIHSTDKKPLELYIKDSLSRNVEVFLYEDKKWLTYFEDGDIMEFGIDRINDERFYLKRKGVSDWLFYDRTNEELDINKIKF